MRMNRANRLGSMMVWRGVAVAVLLVALNTNRVCGQFSPPAGPSAQDVAAAKASAEATSSARWWISVFVLVVLGWFAFSIRGPAISFLKTLTDGFDRGAATTDPKKLMMSDRGMPEHPAHTQSSERVDRPTEPGIRAEAGINASSRLRKMNLRGVDLRVHEFQIALQLE